MRIDTRVMVYSHVYLVQYHCKGTSAFKHPNEWQVHGLMVQCTTMQSVWTLMQTRRCCWRLLMDSSLSIF